MRISQSFTGHITSWLTGAALLALAVGCCTPSLVGTAPPTVLVIGPLSGSTTTCPNAILTANFSEPMNPATISGATFVVSGSGGALVAGSVTYNSANNSATFTPTAVLGSGVTYTATITGGALDLYGNKLAAPYTWAFTTAANGCHPAPVITSLTPTANSTGACPNATVVATFSEAMNPATISAADFTLAPGIIGTVSHNAANTVFTLTPSSSLSAQATYTATITTAAQDTYGNSLVSNYVSSFTTASNACMPAPTVISVTPVAGVTAVCPNKVIGATFSEPIDPTSLSSTSFLITGPGAAPVAGKVSYSSAANQALFAPGTVLALNTTYTATLTTAVRDLYGNILAAPFVWSFTTGANPCAPPAPPATVTPTNGATGVCPNTVITATYAQAMNPLSINATDFTVVAGGIAVAGNVAANATDTVFTFTPTAPVALSTAYTVTITNAAQDSFGNAMAANYVWTFTTGASSCASVAVPTVTNATAPAGAIGVCPNSVATATFSQAMNPSNINTNTFSMIPNIAGTVTLDATDKVATFTPATPFLASTVYTATINTGAQSVAGVALSSNFVWSFTTSSQTCQSIVNLGTAANFGILGASTVTNTGFTVITGENLGLSPGTSVTGFPPGILVSPAVQNVTDATAAQAELDATIAYNNVALLANPAVLPSELSGLTLTPGLYKNASSVTLTSGNLTLDAQGNTNAVFIFQIGSSFVTLGNTKIVLLNGAQAKNIFWQTGSSATLGVNSVFDGTILSFSSITLDTGANLTGRALALNAAVTLDTNIVTAP
ncbi:Ig-like domain-containing protein [Granulicella paludicola]|uniref:Ig-like domain-containing protein n=1 Tax=Granulicella paludicola TaxID=474951 RepID=UPI0021DF76AE|nr:Ig-like domain-containing protein [Granulicella paludicola]